MAIVVIDDKSLPPGPYKKIRPPDATREMRATRNYVYGFPLTEEWFKFRYHHDLGGLGLDKDALEKEKRLHTDMLISHLIRVCDDMEGWVSKCLPTSVETSTLSVCWLLIIGIPGRKPSAESVKKLRKTLKLYGIREKPNWYPEN